MDQNMIDKIRCGWCGNDPLYQDYHDREWGQPLHTEQRLFELLCLEGAQAGLSWITILRKRECYRQAFDDFDATKIARYDAAKVASLLTNSGLVRNKLKINGAIKNARAYLQMRDQGLTLDQYFWSYVDYQPIQNNWHNMTQIPVNTALSEALAKDLKQRGFTFVGGRICYAFMQATGMVNDHLVKCFRHNQLSSV